MFSLHVPSGVLLVDRQSVLHRSLSLRQLAIEALCLCAGSILISKQATPPSSLGVWLKSVCSEDGVAVGLCLAPSAVAGMEVYGTSLDETVRVVSALPLAGASGAEDNQNWWVGGSMMGGIFTKNL